VCGEFQQLGPQLEAHVNAHFASNDPWAAGSAPDDPEVIDLTGDDDASATAAALPRFAPVDVSRLPLGTRPEPGTPVCIHAALRRALLAQRGENAIFRAALCGPPLLHYSGVRGLDAGWGALLCIGQGANRVYAPASLTSDVHVQAADSGTFRCCALTCWAGRRMPAARRCSEAVGSCQTWAASRLGLSAHGRWALTQMALVISAASSRERAAG